MSRVLNIKDCGYKVPDGAVYVGRAMPRCNLPASKWANPFKIGKDGSREEVLEKYRRYLFAMEDYKLPSIIKELKGKDLVCWCAPEPCHADLLLELANKGE